MYWWPNSRLTNWEWRVWALQCHVTGDNLHTCELICSTVGGEPVLSHYCRRCQHTPHCAHGCQGECGAHRQAFFFHQPGPPEQTIKENKTAVVGTWAFRNGIAKEQYRILYYPFHCAWMGKQHRTKWDGWSFKKKKKKLNVSVLQSLDWDQPHLTISLWKDIKVSQ